MKLVCHIANAISACTTPELWACVVHAVMPDSFHPSFASMAYNVSSLPSDILGKRSEASLQLHFVHERSSDPNAIPLIFSHGWPGSFIEAFKMIRKLTDPGACLSSGLFVCTFW